MIPLQKHLKRYKWDSILSSSLAILVGLLFLLLPNASAKILCIMTGVLLLACGLFLLIGHLASEAFLHGSSPFVPVALTLFGLFFLLRPESVQGLLTVLFGIFIVADGAAGLIDALCCLRAREPGWLVLLLLSALFIILGCIVTFGTFDTVMRFGGVCLIVDGISDLIVVLLFSQRIKKAKQKLDRRDDDIIIE